MPLVEKYPTYEALSEAAATTIAEIVNNNPRAVLCLASGNSPGGTFVALARKNINWSECTFISLDEWVGIPAHNTGSCRYMVQEYLFKPLNIRPEQIFFFDGMATDLEGECRKIDEKVAELGGLDVILVGIGLNGHIAMNEPGRPWHLYSHVSELAQSTIEVGQKYFTVSTPLTLGLTVGLRYVQEAKVSILIANGTKKAPAIRQALQGEVGEEFPASIFQTLPNGLVMLDEQAAELLAI